jgi:iron(III) transport system substrate-binding protein
MRRAALLALALAAAAPALAEPEAVAGYGPAAAATRLLVQGTTDIPLFAPALEAFVADRPGLRVDYEQWGSIDLYALARAACEGTRPAADLVISSAVDLQVKLVNDGCALPHLSSQTGMLPPAANWRDELFGVTREPAVIVYNTKLVPPWEAPRSRFDLIDLLRPGDSPYAGRIATYDIEDSGLGFLFAFADSQQATTFGGLIEAFGRSGAVATCCSAEIIDGVAEGRWLIAYNVLGSYALARAAEDERIAVVAPEDYTLVLSRAAMIPRGAARPRPAFAVERDEDEARASVTLSLSALARARRQASTWISIECARAGTGGEERDLVADLHRPVELHGFHRHGGSRGRGRSARRGCPRRGPSGSSASRRRCRRPGWCRPASRWCGSPGWPRARLRSQHVAAGRGRGAGVHVAPPVQVVVDLGRRADHPAVEEDGEGRGLEVALAQPPGPVVGPEQVEHQRRDHRVDVDAEDVRLAPSACSACTSSR